TGTSTEVASRLGRIAGCSPPHESAPQQKIDTAPKILRPENPTLSLVTSEGHERRRGATPRRDVEAVSDTKAVPRCRQNGAVRPSRRTARLAKGLRVRTEGLRAR